MPDPIRFALDEHIAPAVAAGLRRRGVDVTTSQEVDLLGASDEQQLAHAAASRRVFVTQDEVFRRPEMCKKPVYARYTGMVYSQRSH